MSTEDKTKWHLFGFCLVIENIEMGFVSHRRYTGAALVGLAVDSHADISGHRYSSP